MKNNNRRKFVRIEVNDFLDLSPLNEVAKVKGLTKNISPLGICFNSPVLWQKGQVLMINYFISSLAESVKLKLVVKWSEFISDEEGSLCGGEIIEIEKEKENLFLQYYEEKLI